MSNLSSVRLNSFNENFVSETDQDATSLLTELDKGLRSTKIGEQCEAIVRYPKIFEKYPFPILINSSFLKLAEFFRMGSNLLRLWVLRVCQQSEKHVDKILNVDEFVKRIFMVMHSNDPIARALTLRTLGAVACVIPEKEQVHHAIRVALDSHDTVEVEAAIHASVQFAAQSKTFAISMCSKVASMIESLQTPIAMKLQLIPVLRHMHHDANTAALVKTLCINLLPKYPSENFVVVILDSLTQLSCATLVDVPDQVNLLLQYLQDPRKRVRYQILRSMQSLAKRGAHLWPKGALQSLITKAMTCNDLGNEQSLVLLVVLTLTDCPVTCNALLTDEQSIVLELCTSCLVLEHHAAASQALSILTKLVTYCYMENMTPPKAYLDQINLHAESLIYTSLINVKLGKELKQYLKSGVNLSAFNREFGETFVESIGELLTSSFVYPAKHLILLCETLGALCSQFIMKKFDASKAGDKSAVVPSERMETDGDDEMAVPVAQNAFLNLLPRLLKKLEAIVEGGSIKDDEVQLIEILSAVCLQSMLGIFMPKHILDTFERVLNATQYWTQYRIARSASRYGQHFLAAKIYEKLASNVSLEKLHFFLNSLSQISKAECILNNGCEFDQIEQQYANLLPTQRISSVFTLAERLEKAVTLYWKSLATLKASSSPTHPLNFQSECVRLRGQFLEAMFNLVIIKNTQSITPPPAIAQIIAQNSRDHLQKFGHVTNQLRKAVKTLKVCEDLYSKLYKSAFDADPCTLEFLEINQHICAILSYSVESVCFVSPSDAPNIPTVGSYPETKHLIDCCRRIKAELANLPNEQGNQKSITSKHMDTILNQIDIALQTPIGLPRFFFQTLQNTSIKLSISPQPRVSGDPVIVQPGSSLVVKVEGVIQHYGKTPSLYRSVDAVQLTLTSQLISPKSNDFKLPSDTITLSQTVKPHRDFLSGSFLIPLTNIQPTGQYYTPTAIGGQWHVTLEACVIDGDSVIWNTGPKTQLMVRVPDDPSKQINAAGTSMRRF